MRTLYYTRGCWSEQRRTRQQGVHSIGILCSGHLLLKKLLSDSGQICVSFVAILSAFSFNVLQSCHFPLACYAISRQHSAMKGPHVWGICQADARTLSSARTRHESCGYTKSCLLPVGWTGARTLACDHPVADTMNLWNVYLSMV